VSTPRDVALSGYATIVESALGMEAPVAELPVSGGSCNWQCALDPSQQAATSTAVQMSCGSRRETRRFGSDRDMRGS
jgi:hypothetical protein